MDPEKRLEAFEKMLTAVQEKYGSTVAGMARLKASVKEYIETALYLISTPNTGLFFAPGCLNLQ